MAPPLNTYPVVDQASLPAPGNPAAALEVAVPGATFTKLSGWTNVSYYIVPGNTGTYSLYRYWPDTQEWRPEGPRDALPDTFDATPVNSTPVRVSTPTTQILMCAVAWSGDGSGADAEAVIYGENR
jgi:hypothetical protein